MTGEPERNGVQAREHQEEAQEWRLVGGLVQDCP